ncbi:hypothetical protein ACOAPY_06600 [Pseudomonas sp. P3C3]
MKALDLLRCTIISLLLSLAAPGLTMQSAAPEEGEVVMDLSAVSEEQLENAATEEEFENLISSIPKKEIESSWEGSLYAFSHPQIFYFYLVAAAYIFPFIFLASVASSFLSIRSRSRAEPA